MPVAGIPPLVSGAVIASALPIRPLTSMMTTLPSDGAGTTFSTLKRLRNSTSVHVVQVPVVTLVKVRGDVRGRRAPGPVLGIAVVGAGGIGGAGPVVLSGAVQVSLVLGAISAVSGN